MSRAPNLNAVGIDISKAVLALAAEDVAREARPDPLREQPVVDIGDAAAFDLIWLPQPFLSLAVLGQGLPRLHRAMRPGGAVVMPINTNADSGPIGAITDLRNLITDGATTTASTAEVMLAEAGLTNIRVLDLPGGTVLSPPPANKPAISG